MSDKGLTIGKVVFETDRVAVIRAANPRIIKAKDKPPMTENDFRRNEINYMMMLMEKYRDKALAKAQELALT